MVNGGILNNATPLLINPVTHACRICPFIISMEEIQNAAAPPSDIHWEFQIQMVECRDSPLFKAFMKKCFFNTTFIWWHSVQKIMSRTKVTLTRYIHARKSDELKLLKNIPKISSLFNPEIASTTTKKTRIKSFKTVVIIMMWKKAKCAFY